VARRNNVYSKIVMSVIPIKINKNIRGYIQGMAKSDPYMDISMDISMDIHIHGNPGNHTDG